MEGISGSRLIKSFTQELSITSSTSLGISEVPQLSFCRFVDGYLEATQHSTQHIVSHHLCTNSEAVKILRKRFSLNLSQTTQALQSLQRSTFHFVQDTTCGLRLFSSHSCALAASQIKTRSNWMCSRKEARGLKKISTFTR